MLQKLPPFAKFSICKKFFFRKIGTKNGERFPTSATTKNL